MTDTDITIRVPNVPYTEKPNKYQSNLVLIDIDGGVLTKNKDYTIEASDILSATIKIGKTKTALKLGTDYEIAAYNNNLKKGTATVVFRGIGAYSGEKTVKFKINSATIE